MSSSPKEIKTNFEYLRKLFIMPDSADKFIEFGRELLDMIHDFFQEKGGIHSSISLPQLIDIFNQIAIPEDPHLIKDVLLEIKTKVIALNVKIYKALRQDDTNFVSRTTLESTRYRPQNIVVLRAVLINPLTDQEVLREIAETQNRIGLQLWSEFKWAFERLAPKTEGCARVREAST